VFDRSLEGEAEPAAVPAEQPAATFQLSDAPDVVVSLWASAAPRDLPPGTETLRLQPTPRSLLP